MAKVNPVLGLYKSPTEFGLKYGEQYDGNKSAMTQFAEYAIAAKIVAVKPIVREEQGKDDKGRAFTKTVIIRQGKEVDEDAATEFKDALATRYSQSGKYKSVSYVIVSEADGTARVVKEGTKDCARVVSMDAYNMAESELRKLPGKKLDSTMGAANFDLGHKDFDADNEVSVRQIVAWVRNQVNEYVGERYRELTRVANPTVKAEREVVEDAVWFDKKITPIIKRAVKNGHCTAAQGAAAARIFKHHIMAVVNKDSAASSEVNEA
jgi:hypothetical protein